MLYCIIFNITTKSESLVHCPLFFFACIMTDKDALCRSDDPHHPANLIPELCRQFYHLGWVTGTGGGISIRKE